MNIEPNILVVDDDSDLRKTISDILRTRAYTPVTAATGKEALNKASEEKFVVALIDLRLEDMSGLEVMRVIKEHSPSTECIFITGYASQPSAIGALNLGAYSYIQKPYDIKQLLETIRMAIEKQRVVKALQESEERYRTLFEGSRDAIYITNGHNKFIDINQATLDLFRFTRAEFMIMKPCEIFVNSGDQKELAEEIKQTGHVKDYEIKFHKSGGEQMTCLITSTERRANDGSLLEYQTIVRDITEQKLNQHRLQETLKRLRKAMEGTIKAMALMVEIRDPYTAGHQQRMTDLACAIAEEIGLSEEQIDGIRMAGIIHDLGKIAVPAEILSKPGRLTESEFDIIKTHPQVGCDILKEIGLPWPIDQIVMQHHEMMDGSGYPQGISGEEIILEARILSVADIVEAMASHRPYREALGVDKALEEISQNRGVLYDPDVVDACLKLFTEKGFEFDKDRL